MSAAFFPSFWGIFLSLPFDVQGHLSPLCISGKLKPKSKPVEPLVTQVFERMILKGNRK